MDLRRKHYIVDGERDKAAVASLLWDFVGIGKFCEDWGTNIKMIEELKNVSDWDSHKKVESKAIRDPGARTLLFT